jgi:RNA polymerase sigma factor (sigma-70 family)
VIWLEDVELADSDLSPEQRLIENERWKQLQVVVQTLSEQQREIVVLRYVLGWKVKRIATHLGMAENTVSVTLRRIIQRLQTEVQKRQEEDRA